MLNELKRIRKKYRHDATFKEEDHPRAKDGKFTSGNSSAGNSSSDFKKKFLELSKKGSISGSDKDVWNDKDKIIRLHKNGELSTKDIAPWLAESSDKEVYDAVSESGMPESLEDAFNKVYESDDYTIGDDYIEYNFEVDDEYAKDGDMIGSGRVRVYTDFTVDVEDNSYELVS